MGGLEINALSGTKWSDLDHWRAWERLVQVGWEPCGEGDWAFAYRSPSEALVARVAPFEPAYDWFVRLCERCPANPYLPRIELATPLSGGGHLAVLERLMPADEATVEQVLAQWKSGGGTALREVRAEARALDQAARRTLRWWGGIDLGDHVLVDRGGQPKLIDLFFVDGNAMCDALIADPADFARAYPADRRRYLLDAPHFGRSYAADQYTQVSAALAKIEDG